MPEIYNIPHWYDNPSLRNFPYYVILPVSVIIDYCICAMRKTLISWNVQPARTSESRQGKRGYFHKDMVSVQRYYF